MQRGLGKGGSRDERRLRDGEPGTERGGSRGCAPGSGRGMRGRAPGMRSPKYTVLSHLGHLDAMAGEWSRTEPCRAAPCRAVRPAPPGPRPLAPPPPPPPPRAGGGRGGAARGASARLGSARLRHGRAPLSTAPSTAGARARPAEPPPGSKLPLPCSPSLKAQRMQVLTIPLAGEGGRKKI